MTRTPHISKTLPRHAKPRRLTPAKAVAIPLLAASLAAIGGTANALPNLIQDPGFTPLSPSSVTVGSTAYTSLELGTWGSNTVTVPSWSSPGANALNFVFLTSGATAYGNAGLFGLAQPTLIAPTPIAGNFVAADGSSSYSGAITQTLTNLTPNKAATLTFYWGLDQQNTATCGGNCTGTVGGQWQVSLGGPSQDTTLISNQATQTFSGWMQSTMTFVPTSATETLQFLAVGSGAPSILLLNGDSLTQSISEPASWAITLAGIVGLGVLSRRRQRSAPPPAAA
jgi:hypothetical protein